ncbi:sodium channel and clathrin linker 1-like isoform X3 [Tachypleus tridentatus]|uniref:sodium channel and clathrin linker 1-like isoform X3 n=3 Tax=Tachypleus tridentatus TaxID=6853 RepID=UPI003FD59643
MMLEPFLSEYDQNLEALQSEIKLYKDQLRDLRNQVVQLVDENKRLNDKLKESVEWKFDGVVEKESEIVKNLQEQLQNTNEAKDTALKMWQLSLEEIERLEKEIQSKQESPDMKEMDKMANQVKEEFSKALAIVNSELTQTKEELVKIKAAHQASSSELKGIQQTLENVESQLAEKKTECEEKATKLENYQSRLLKSESEASDMKLRLLTKEDEVMYLKQCLEEREATLNKVQQQKENIESHEAEAIQQARESIRLAENAVMEKDEAVFREHQAVKEAQRLQTSINHLMEMAAVRTKQEVENIKKKCNENLKTLTEEIQTLEQENTNKQAQIERAIREKRSVELELEAVYKNGISKGPENSLLLKSLTDRLTKAERLRDEANLRLETLEAELKRIRKSHQQQITHYKNENNCFKEWLKKKQSDFDSVSTEKIHLANSLEKLRHNCQSLEEETKLLKKKYEKEVTVHRTQLEKVEQQFQLNSKMKEESHQASITELVTLLDAQQKLSKKWKKELQELTKKFVSQVEYFDKDISLLKENNKRLQSLLNDQHKKNLLLQQQLQTSLLENKQLKQLQDSQKH